MQFRYFTSLALSLALSEAASAQSSIFLPNGYATVGGTTNNTYPWGRNALAIRFQNVFDTTHFTAQGVNYPILISGVRWRAHTAATSWTGTTYNNVEVSFASAALDWAAVSPTWTLNRGPDFTRMLTGAVNFLPGTGNGPGVPGPNVVDLSFATPFLYDPNSGNDFLVEVAYAAGSNTGGSTASCDAVATGVSTSRVFNTTDPNQPSGTVGVDHALVMELVYIPASGLHPNFRGTPISGPTGTTVSFTDLTFTSDPLGVQTWAWDLDGDSITDTNAQNPSFTYGLEGSYDVRLIVTDTLHPQASELKVDYILIDAVDASFTTTTVGSSRVRFTDTSAGNPTTWQWDFENDGIVDSTLQNPVHTYPAPGSYSVRLVVADAFSNDTAIVSLGVSVLPIPTFGSTYTNAAQTRGLYFQTPVRFSIVSAKVPDETGHGLQNVAIYRLVGAPPVYTASASGGLEFLSTGQPSAAAIPCSVSFDAGAWVGVLGGCGDASTMRSSYASTGVPFPSSIFGNPVTLARFITQTNLVTAGGQGPYSSASGTLARVELGISSATGLPYGTGTPAGGGHAAPILTTTSVPRIGSTSELTVTQQDPTAFGFLMLSLGRGNLSLPFGTLLIDIFTFQFTLPMNAGAPMNVGATSYSLNVPNDPVLNGAGPVTWQNLNLVPGSPNQLSLSNGQEWFSGF